MLRKAINQFRYVITFPYNIIMMGIHRYQWSKFPTVYGRSYLRGFGKVNIGNNVVINSTYKTISMVEDLEQLFCVLVREI